MAGFWPPASTRCRLKIATLTEAEVFHRALFPGTAMPADLEARYLQARDRFFANDEAAALVAHVVENGLDVEALEYALRVRRGTNGLTRRFQVMLSLCEVRSAYDGRFVQHRAARAAAWAGAPVLGLRAGWKLMRGWYLLRARGLDRFLHV
jgi:hypothetical protein